MRGFLQRRRGARSRCPPPSPSLPAIRGKEFHSRIWQRKFLRNSLRKKWYKHCSNLCCKVLKAKQLTWADHISIALPESHDGAQGQLRAKDPSPSRRASSPSPKPQLRPARSNRLTASTQFASWQKHSGLCRNYPQTPPSPRRLLP